MCMSNNQWLDQQAQYNVNYRYMIDGIPMSFEQFINVLYPEDCAEKTLLTLKLKGGLYGTESNKNKTNY